MRMAHSKRKRTLADDIADLLNPLPEGGEGPKDRNPLDTGAHVLESDEELAAMADTGRARILPDISLEDAAYAGKKSSRREAFDEDNDLDDAGSPRDYGGIDDAAESEEEEEDEVYAVGGGVTAAEGEIAALERAVDELQGEEHDTAVHLAERAKAERKKALAVKTQCRLWESALELRILLQRLLKAAVRMPQGAMLDAMASAQDSTRETLNELKLDGYDAANSFLDVLSGLCAVNPSVAPHPPIRRTQQTCQGLWKEIDSWYHAMKPFQDASIDRWQRKTLVSGGNLKALNQPVSAQVDLFMQHADAAVQRTHILKQHVAVIGREPNVSANNTLQEDDKARDPETFDDTEFYSTLLKEFLEASDSTKLASHQYAGEKRRKIVDRRASKGRKIRYEVQDKLMNFMAPRDTGSSALASRLFGNLFGSRT